MLFLFKQLLFASGFSEMNLDWNWKLGYSSYILIVKDEDNGLKKMCLCSYGASGITLKIFVLLWLMLMQKKNGTKTDNS